MRDAMLHRPTPAATVLPMTAGRLTALWEDRRLGFVVAFVVAAVAAVIAARLMPRGPVTTPEALGSMSGGLVVGIVAGLVTGSRWTALAVPALFLVAYEAARLGTAGPTVDAIQLGSIYGVFAFVFPTLQRDRSLAALADASLRLVRSRDIVFREGDTPLITLFAASRADDLPRTYEAFAEPPLTIRRRDGGVDAEYSAIRLSFGFPPGNVPG